jgi:hypothetical protein
MAATLADLHAEALLRRPLLRVANPDAFAGAAPYAALAGPTRAAVEACGATPADPTAVADADLAPLAPRWGMVVDLLLLYAFRDAVGAFAAVSTAVGGVGTARSTSDIHARLVDARDDLERHCRVAYGVGVPRLVSARRDLGFASGRHRRHRPEL